MILLNLLIPNLIGLIVLILVVFLIDIFTSDHDIPELKVELHDEKLNNVPVLDDFDVDIGDDMDIVKKKVAVPKEDLVKNLNLLGIITGKENQAIVEDKKSKKTMFLYKGDSLGEFTVYDIKEKGIVLDYNGEKIELNI